MNDEKENRCAFLIIGMRSNYCGILEDISCDGHDPLCKFRKSTEQHQRDTDRAIKANRERGFCNNCKYRKTPCKLSTEK